MVVVSNLGKFYDLLKYDIFTVYPAGLGFGSWAYLKFMITTSSSLNASKLMVKGYKYNQVARNLEGVFVQSITEYFKSLLA